VFCAPAVSCAVKKAHEVVTTGSPNSPAFPAQWFYGLFRALLGEPGLIATVTPEKQLASHGLDLSVGRSGPHDFAVRKSIVRLSMRLRPSHPALYVRDDREAPLFQARDGGISGSDLPDDTSPIFFVSGLDHPNQLETIYEIRFCARAITDIYG
jgi:hypothetical protein